MTDLLLGLDLGTGSSKAVLATPDGEVVRTATRPHEMSLPRPGWAEVDAESVWWTDAASLCRELTSTIAPDAVVGVCVSGVGPCLLLTDGQNTPVRPAILYGIDSRATAEIRELTLRYGADQIVQRGGSALTTQAVGPKMLWVRKHEPSAWEASKRFYNSSSFIAAKLTGEYVLDHHTASQCDPLYDIRVRGWAEDWASDVAGHLQLPRLAWPAEVVGSVSGQAARKTGLAPGTPVCAGTVDAWAEAFSVGVRHPGDLMIMYGSTAFFVQVLPELRSDPALWTTAGVEPGSYTFAAGTNTSGSLTTWVQRLVGDVPFDQLVAEASVVPAGSDGLMVLPYFAGERMPVADPDARGVIAGLSLRHGRAHLFRAAYEGIAFGIRQILGQLDAAGGTAHRIVAVGGGTQGGLWTQVVSDVTGRVQELPYQTIGASYGDALMAAIGTGTVAPDTDWTRSLRQVTPDPGPQEVYDRLFPTYCSLYPATRNQVHTLAGLQRGV